MNESFDVFLSHNSKDKESVRALALALQLRGTKVWLDEWELVPGLPWQEAVERVIETTRSSAVLVGRDGLGPWQDKEMRGCLSEFVSRGLPVIPVLLPGAPESPVLPIFLKGLTWVDARQGLSDEVLDRLQWGITGSRIERPNLPVNAGVSTESNGGQQSAGLGGLRRIRSPLWRKRAAFLGLCAILGAAGFLHYSIERNQQAKVSPRGSIDDRPIASTSKVNPTGEQGTLGKEPSEAQPTTRRGSRAPVLPSPPPEGPQRGQEDLEFFSEQGASHRPNSGINPVSEKLSCSTKRDAFDGYGSGSKDIGANSFVAIDRETFKTTLGMPYYFDKRCFDCRVKAESFRISSTVWGDGKTSTYGLYTLDTSEVRGEMYTFEVDAKGTAYLKHYRDGRDTATLWAGAFPTSQERNRLTLEARKGLLIASVNGSILAQAKFNSDELPDVPLGSGYFVGAGSQVPASVWFDDYEFTACFPVPDL